MKVKKTELQAFYKTLCKLTDNRFSFCVCKHFQNNKFYLLLQIGFCENLVHSVLLDDLSQQSAIDALIDLCNYAELKHDQAYFDRFGISFELYYNSLGNKSYFMFRKNESEKWVKIGKELARLILEQNDISIIGEKKNVVSYAQYDCYYRVNLKEV